MSDTRPTQTITLAHGAGGKAMRELIDAVFLETFDYVALAGGEDQARLPLDQFTALGDQLALTTDSYVVDPLFFPGGDIGSLAVNGTVNDLAVGGARPLYLSCGMVIEEGLPLDTLRRVAHSMKAAADTARVRIVTGDTKVVHRGAADKLFINTAGVGVIYRGCDIRAARATPGDKIIINGYVGDHGAAIVDARGELALQSSIASDCQALNTLVERMLSVCPDIHCLRDATRGGLATVLNEFARASGTSMRLDENALPVRPEVRGMCELLGLDPLYLANEGKLVAIVPAERADSMLHAMRDVAGSEHACIIGEVRADNPGRVILGTAFGGDRIVDMLVGEQLPRIC